MNTKTRIGRTDAGKVMLLIALIISAVLLGCSPARTADRYVEFAPKNSKLIHLRLGKTERFRLTKKYSDEIFVLTSSNPKVVAVNNNGYVKGLKAGTSVTVTVTAKRTKNKTVRKIGTYSVKAYDTSASGVYKSLVSLKNKAGFRQGEAWTNAKTYIPNVNVGSKYGGLSSSRDVYCGCRAFALRLSDYAYGSVRGSAYYDASRISAGDVLYLNGKMTLTNGIVETFDRQYGHFVVVLKVSGDRIYFAEGNFNGRVNWNGCVTKSNVRTAFKAGMTRN